MPRELAMLASMMRAILLRILREPLACAEVTLHLLHVLLVVVVVELLYWCLSCCVCS